MVIFGDLCPEAEQMLFQRLGATPMPGKDAAPGLGGTGSLLPVCRPATPIELRIPGKHNQANAACVLTVCRAMGFDEETTRSALASFSGLPHRIQFVRTIDGVDYFNDSKSTAPSATMVAVESFDRPIVAMIGGQKKDVALSAFCETLVRSCRAVVCVGECGASFAQAVRSVAAGETHARRTVVHRVQRLEDGLQLARHEARPGDVVLFSPGAPSFDGYANFTQRGDHFMRIVQSL